MLPSFPKVQKRPRQMSPIETEFTPVIETKNDKNSYAYRLYGGPRRKDVDVNKDSKERTQDERNKIKILKPTAEIPFKQVVLDSDFRDNLENQWKDAILIKVLGKPWYYPQLVAKLDILWALHGDAEMLDLGNNCYCIKGMSDKKREMILTEGPWQLAGSFLSIRKWTPGFSSR